MGAHPYLPPCLVCLAALLLEYQRWLQPCAQFDLCLSSWSASDKQAPCPLLTTMGARPDVCAEAVAHLQYRMSLPAVLPLFCMPVGQFRIQIHRSYHSRETPMLCAHDARACHCTRSHSYMLRCSMPARALPPRQSKRVKVWQALSTEFEREPIWVEGCRGERHKKGRLIIMIHFT